MSPVEKQIDDPSYLASTLYSPERVSAWVRGEITLAELSAVSGAEMLEMAVIGYSMYEQGRYDDARVIFDALCALDPREAYYRTALGAVYLARENLEKAEALFQEAIRLNPKEIAAFVNRGEVYLRQGKILEAARDFKRAVDLDPENRDPLTRRARLLAAAALQTLEAASSVASDPRMAAAPRAASSQKPAPAKSSTQQKSKPMSGKPGASKMQAQPRGAGAVPRKK
jgi:tetratricopeptide (TPR) repeat protein